MIDTVLAHAGQAHPLTASQVLLLAAVVVATLPFLIRPARPLLSTVAFASVLAGAIHAVAAPEHLEESALLGAGFLAAGAAQALAAALLVQSPRAAFSWLTAAANLGCLVVWGVSRTAGLPFGPGAGVPETVGLLDGLSAAAQLVALVGGAWLAVDSAQTPRSVRWAPRAGSLGPSVRDFRP